MVIINFNFRILTNITYIYKKEEPNGIFNICGRIKKTYTKE